LRRTGSHLLLNKEEELALVNPVARKVFPTRREPLGLAPGLEEEERG
jgi:hypothetical protein